MNIVLFWITYYFYWFAIIVFNTAISFFATISDITSTLTNGIDTHFDYIIVGGGSAGAIVALRLSEISHVSVLLIEAGSDAPGLLRIPVLGPLKQGSKLDWQHKTLPQNHACFGLNDNSSTWPMGKILGGSTHLNFMIYLKGHERDFSSWKRHDSPEWDIADINYYFNKAVRCIGDANAKRICDKRGSLSVRESFFTTDLSKAVLKAASEMGYNVTDLNAEGGVGFMRPHVNIDGSGRRWTSDQNLKGALSERENLKLATNVAVERILLRNDFEAYGVEYRRADGSRGRVFAREEVVLSAGTVGSAKILMLSGVGPGDVLSDAKIKTKVNLPVGENLQDHITTGLDLVMINRSEFSLGHLTDPRSAYEYFVNGRGPYTSTMVEAVGVVHSDLVDPSADSPDLEFMVMMAGSSSDGGLLSRHAFGISDKLWNEYFALLTAETAVSILPVLLHPKSSGEVKLDPKDPNGSPQINPRYLSDDGDVTTLTEGIRIIQRLLNTKAMKDFGARLNTMKLPGCEHFRFDSNDYWKCYVRHLTLTSYHPVGTCRMGERDSVVDHRLRVHKTNKLRVVDASIMPTMPSANTNAAVVMIAEKGADLIKEDYHGRRCKSSYRRALFADGQCKCFAASPPPPPPGSFT